MKIHCVWNDISKFWKVIKVDDLGVPDVLVGAKSLEELNSAYFEVQSRI
jgi:hypothetical protein